MTDPKQVTEAAANRAGLFALAATLAAAGVLPRERSGHVLDAMFDAILRSDLPLPDQQALLDDLRQDWTKAGGTGASH